MEPSFTLRFNCKILNSDSSKLMGEIYRKPICLGKYIKLYGHRETYIVFHQWLNWGSKQWDLESEILNLSPLCQIKVVTYLNTF